MRKKKHTKNICNFIAIGSVILFITSLIAIFICAYFLDANHPLWDLLFVYGLISLPVSIVIFFIYIFLMCKYSEWQEKKEIQKELNSKRKQQAEARKLQSKIDNMVKEHTSNKIYKD